MAEPALAGGDLDAMLEAAMARAQDAGEGEDATVVLIGHEPSVSELFARLTGGSRAQSLEFRKGGAALVELRGAPAEGGRLIWYLSPRVLRTLGEG